MKIKSYLKRNLSVGLWLAVAWLSACGHRTLARPDAVILVDVSDSQTLNCNCIAQTFQTVGQWPGVHPQSALWLTATGDRQTAYEPEFVASSKLVAGTAQEGEHLVQLRRTAYAEAARQACGKLALKKDTPLFLAIKRLTAQLQTTALAAPAHHYLIVKTDGLETIEPALVTALRNQNYPLTQLPQIDNRQVKIVFLGLAETLGTNAGLAAQRSAAHADRLQAIWQAVFTHPELVEFKPLCLATVDHLAAATLAD